MIAGMSDARAATYVYVTDRPQPEFVRGDVDFAKGYSGRILGFRGWGSVHGGLGCRCE
jgi:hypothetical protein